MNTIKSFPALVLSTLCIFPMSHAFAQVEEDIVRENDVIIRSEAKKFADAAADAQREVERSMKDVERQIKVAQAHAVTVGPALKRAFGAGFASSTEAPLIVATTSLDATALAELREDLIVMGKLVNDAVADQREDAAVHRAMGIVVNWLPGGATADNLYIAGHGAVVQSSVRYPLEPPKQEETAKPTEAPKNSAWESARRELFGREIEEAEVVFPPERREEYDADRVESLKKNLLKALANASNFRRLGGDETVTAVVRSRTGSRSQVFMYRSHDSVAKTPATSNEPDATMTIRIKKSDADDLAAEKITEDEFRKRAKVAIY
jgi:hypothetical protein